MPQPARYDEGLTLIELLIVIALVGVIAAIALPILFSTLNNAQASVDKNQQAEIDKFNTQWAAAGYTLDTAVQNNKLYVVAKDPATGKIVAQIEDAAATHGASFLVSPYTPGVDDKDLWSTLTGFDFSAPGAASSNITVDSYDANSGQLTFTVAGLNSLSNVGTLSLHAIAAAPSDVQFYDPASVQPTELTGATVNRNGDTATFTVNVNDIPGFIDIQDTAFYVAGAVQPFQITPN